MLLDVSLYNDLSQHEIAGGFALIVVFYAIYKSLTRWRDPIVETRYLDKLEAEREALRAKGTPLSPPGRYCVVGTLGFAHLCLALVTHTPPLPRDRRRLLRPRHLCCIGAMGV